jgi:hypothetical protein
VARSESRVTIQGIMMHVVKVAGLSQVYLLVAFAIAIHANSDGEAWPSIERLVTYTRLARRTVQRSIQRLGDLRIIYIERGGGRRPGGASKTSRYVFFPEGDGPDFGALFSRLCGDKFVDIT